MNSEPLPARFAKRVAAGRCRLHSLLFLIEARLWAAMFGCCIYGVIGLAIDAEPKLGLVRVSGEGTLYVLVLLAFMYMTWFRRKVVATAAGLEVGSGKRRRIIPWPEVVDVREQPWIRFSQPWSPKMWQVDLLHGKPFDFVGVQRSQKIVAAFIETWSS